MMNLLPDNADLTIIFAARYRGNNISEVHLHRIFQLYVLSTDRLEFFDGTNTFYPDPEREIVLVKPLVEHAMRLRSSGGNSDWLAPDINCALDCKFAVNDASLAEKLSELPEIIDVGNTEFYRSLSSLLIRALSMPDGSGLSAALSALNTMLYSLILPSDNSDSPYFYSSNHQSVENSRGINAVKRYLDLHYRENVTLNDLVQLSAINRTTLCDNFRKTYGFTPKNYILNLRMIEAEQLLAETDIEISELALRLGFANSTYFCNFFRGRKGITPLAYRLNEKSRLRRL